MLLMIALRGRRGGLRGYGVCLFVGIRSEGGQRACEVGLHVGPL